MHEWHQLLYAGAHGQIQACSPRCSELLTLLLHARLLLHRGRLAPCGLQFRRQSHPAVLKLTLDGPAEEFPTAGF